MKRMFFRIILGALMIVVGVYMIMRPSDFLTVVISLFGFYLAVDGLRTLVAAIKLRGMLGKGLCIVSIFKAVLNIGLGVGAIAVSVSRPDLIPTVVIYIVAADFALTALIDLIDVVRLTSRGFDASSLVFEIILSALFAVILFLFPKFLTTVVMTLFAAIVLAAGAMTIYNGISTAIFQRKFKKLNKENNIDVTVD